MMNVFKNNRVLVVLFFMLFSMNSRACDVCSCGSSNSSSFGNTMQGSFVGLLYNYMFFHFEEGVFANSPIGKDHVNTITISGQYQINEKVQINALLPYRFNHRYTSSENVHNNGIGDISLYGTYDFFVRKEEHSLKLGAGLKLPTGKFDLVSSQSNKTSATQLGTGSLDLMFPVSYTYAHKDFSFNIGAVYFVKNENEEKFKYGNQTQVNVNFSYAFELKNKVVIVPMLGLSYDAFLPTERFDLVDNRTSGYMTNGSFGLEANVKNMVFGMNGKIPIAQNLIEGEVSFKKGVSLYSFWRF